MANSTDRYANVRSGNSNKESHVRFFNKTSRTIDIYWADYDGRHVLYDTLAPNQGYDIRTFVTHPWLFRDSATGDCLVTLPNRQYVYYPKEYKLNSDVPRAVVIVDPLRTLKELCIQKCRQLFEASGSRLRTLFELPATVQAELNEAMRSAADYRERSGAIDEESSGSDPV